MELLKTIRRAGVLLMGGCLSLSLLSANTVRAQDAPGTPQETPKKGTAKQEAKEKEKEKPTSPDTSSNSDPSNSSSSNSSSSNSSSSNETAELPLLLLLVQRPLGIPVHREDANAALSTMLRSTLRESRKYQVILYSADHPSIRRALLEHSIAATELIEPIKPAAMQKLAVLLGARHILMVSSVLDKVGMKTDIRLMQDLGVDTWVTPRSEPVSVDAQFGKLHLKTDQMVALTVDSIDTYLGIPSHLASNIHLSRTKLIGKPTVAKDTKNSQDKNAGSQNSNEKTSENSSENSKESSDKVAVNGVPAPLHRADNTQQIDTTAVKPPAGTDGTSAGPDVAMAAPVKKTPKPKTSPKPTRATQAAKNDNNVRAADSVQGSASETPTLPPVSAKAGSGDSGSRPDRSGSDQTTGQTAGRNPARNAAQTAILATDAGAVLLSEPKIVPPVPPVDRANYEALADRYRHVGDLPNSIEALRKAIDVKPLDLSLRKKLIVAYQDRQLLEQALAETERAMLIAPNDGDLSRLYANCLTAKGDTAGAAKLLRDTVAANPKNTAAQVALGDVLLAENQYIDASRAFEAAAGNDPKSPLPHRRLARVLAARADGDPMQYTGCLQQIEDARRLTPPTDTLTYQGDYFEIMLMLEARLKDMLDQVNEAYNGVKTRPLKESERITKELNTRAETASDFIDKLQPAVGQDTMHAHFAQGAVLLVQAVGFLRKYIKSNDAQIGSSLRGTRIDALSEFSTAHNRLIIARTALEKGRAATGETINGN